MDYSSYYLDARKHLDKAYKEVLEKDFNSAVADVELAIVELRLLKASLEVKVKPE